MRLFPLILILFFGVMSIGCNSTGCLENRSSIPMVEFYSSTTEEPITPDSIAIGGVGAPNDSLLLTEKQRVGKIYLPFRSNKTSAAYYIDYRWKGVPDGFTDTVWFDYKAIPYFASSECGAMYRYRIENVRHTDILLDSVVLLDSLITNIQEPSIRFYFPTGKNESEQ